jgi:hypothetical protein
MYYSTFMPVARLLVIHTRNSIDVNGSAVDGTWNSKLDYPQPLLHNPIYRSLKALGSEVDDFLSEIFHHKDKSLSSPPNEYLTLSSLLNKVTSTQLDFNSTRLQHKTLLATLKTGFWWFSLGSALSAPFGRGEYAKGIL